MERGEGVQIVSLSANHKYELNEAALENILLQENVRDCPVVVVSVAGAYRGGKSFLLNFFLRYLHAQDAGRRNDDWLGAPDESLSGFSWRGGVERNTTGIVMWSQPIRVPLPSGETVAVLLIDTQGTFDSESTVRDCSTIFALSTLLSSVQIYNLSQQIREDDLQYLQLFTSYGKCAANDDSGRRPFQKLKFLVRDWSSPYEYAYGADGGKQFLQKKLQINPQQAAELQEIRQHILSCFDSVDCFLMPHPGLRVVSEKDYNGCIADIMNNFQESLKQLVPLIFESTNLTPKRINGKPVTASDLYYYFKKYMEIFNSDTLPAPRTILQATAEAALLAACESARRHYRARMKSVCDATKDVAVTRTALRKTHQEAIQEGRRLLSSSMATQQEVDSVFSHISQELEEQFSQYELVNNFIILNAIATAERAYTDSFGGTEQLCLHPLELRNVHNCAMEAAIRVFDSIMISPEDGQDDNEDKNDLLKNLEARLEQLSAINELNNNAAVSEARDSYVTFMENVCGDQPCMNARQMELKHEDAKTMAIEVFCSKRNRNPDYSEDIYKSQLIKDIEERCGRYETMNENNNQSLIERAVLLYDNDMRSICSTDLPSLHPEDLRQEHEDAKERAVNEFHAGRVYGDTDNDDDVHKQTLLEKLSFHYTRFENINDTNNAQGYERGCSAYDDVMNAACAPGLLRRPVQEMEAAHCRGVRASKTAFKRRSGPSRSIDSYKQRLDTYLGERYAYYCEMNNNNPEPAMDVAMLIVGTAVVAGTTAAILASGGIAVATGAAVIGTETIAATATAAVGAASTTALTVWHLECRYAYYCNMNEMAIGAMDVATLAAGATVLAGATVAFVTTGGMAAIGAAVGALAPESVVATAIAATGASPTVAAVAAAPAAALTAAASTFALTTLNLYRRIRDRF